MTQPLSVPDPEDIIADLAPFTRDLYRALEAAVLKAREYFEREGCEEIERFLFADMVRFWAKSYLQQLGHEVEDLLNNGLSIFYGGSTIRIRKVDNGRIPSPGHSRVLQAFYRQNRPIQRPLPGMRTFLYPVEAGQIASNFIVAWDLTPSYNMAELELACPSSGNSDRDSTQVFWRVPLPNPVFSTLAASAPSVAVADDEDLYSLPEDEETASSQAK
jgi:hypothetical protein